MLSLNNRNEFVSLICALKRQKYMDGIVLRLLNDQKRITINWYLIAYHGFVHTDCRNTYNS